MYYMFIVCTHINGALSAELLARFLTDFIQFFEVYVGRRHLWKPFEVPLARLTAKI